MTKKQKKNLIRIIVTSALIIILLFLPIEGLLRLLLFLIPYLIIGYDIIIKAVKGVINLQPFDECFLMCIATIGALIIAVATDGDYLEAIAVMLFYQVGEWFQSYAVGKSRRNISELMDIRPDYANIEQDGELVKVDPDEVETGTIITVRPGEKIPIDGIITEGSSVIDTSALTGESIPREVCEGDQVLSGCINKNGLLKIRTTKDFEESTVSEILELVENASSRKSRSENFITKFARVYTPVVVLSAAALAVVPPLIRMLFLSMAPNWSIWIYRALTFLVISCPCALVISIPLSFFAGIGGASKQGILIKGSNFLEMLSKAGIVVFDKTGTLTKGSFEVDKIVSQDISSEKLLEYAASAELYSTHPIAISLRNKAEGMSLQKPENTEDISGQGIKAVINGEELLVGNEKLMHNKGISPAEVTENGTVVHVAVNSSYKGYIIIRDQIKPDAEKAVSSLSEQGIHKIVMLTGDNAVTANETAAELGIKEVYSELLPSDKVEKTEELLYSKAEKESLVFVGDGVNDAPVLSIADIGISMGALGSDAAIEASDIVLMDDDPCKISKSISISRKCMRIVHENIVFAIGVKLLCLVLGALGIANMWLAVFGDVGVLIIAILNAMRCMRRLNRE